MASPRPAHVISRRAVRATPVATRGWVGGVSRLAASSFAPEPSICSASETPDKSPSLTRLLKCVQGYTKVEGCQGAHSSFTRRSSGFGVSLEPPGDLRGVEGSRATPGPRPRRGLRALAAWPRCRSRTLDLSGINEVNRLKEFGFVSQVSLGRVPRSEEGGIPPSWTNQNLPLLQSCSLNRPMLQ